ncbi:MAG: hypothetical protein CML46_19955 [Rhodobacteraceae bacterium]|nr:hypothetical protein [Paracoccaceae bacterium]MBR29185.1 hypothetical protein [Paracoccaceae bacterium]
MKRGKRWYFHRRVPGDLKEVFTREFWRESLNTDSETEAGISVIPHIQRTNDLIAQARQGTLRRLDDDQIDDLSMEWADHYAEVAEELMVAEIFPHLQIGDVSPFSSGARYGEEPSTAVLRDRNQLASEVRRWLSSYRDDVRAEGADWEKLLDACHILWTIKHSAISQNPGVDALRIPGLKLGESLTADLIEALAKGDQSPSDTATIRDAFERYLAEKSSSERRGGISNRTVQEWNTALRRFCDVHGDMEIEQIARSHVLAFRDALRKLPSRPPRFVIARPVDEQIKWAEKNDHCRLSDTTVAKQVTALSVVLDFAFRETDLIVHRTQWENPCAGIKSRRDGRHPSSRKPFSNEQVKEIFEHHARLPKRASDYWVPLVLYYTGARLTEIAQLLARDVIFEGATPHIRITLDDQSLIRQQYGAEHEKRLKTRYSERLVPLHDELIEIGFVDYATSIKRSGELFLFPDLEHDKGESRARNMSRRFHRKMRRLGAIGEEDEVLHSFRHFFKMKSLEVGNAESVTKLIMGHNVQDDVSTSNYARHFQRAVDEAKRVIIDTIPLPKLNINELKNSGQRFIA